MNTTMRVMFGWVVFTLIAVLTHSISLLPYFIVSVSFFFVWFVVYMFVTFIRCFQRDRRDRRESVSKSNPVNPESLRVSDSLNVFVECALLRSVKLCGPDGMSVRVPRGAVVSCLGAALGDDEAMCTWVRRSGVVLRGWVDVAALKPKKSSSTV